MKVNREQFLAAVLAAGLSGAVACGSEEPPAAAEPIESAGGEEVGVEEEPAFEEAPVEEAEPEIEEAGPTPE